jgi:hypothetical protein
VFRFLPLRRLASSLRPAPPCFAHHSRSLALTPPLTVSTSSPPAHQPPLSSSPPANHPPISSTPRRRPSPPHLMPWAPPPAPIQTGRRIMPSSPPPRGSGRHLLQHADSGSSAPIRSSSCLPSIVLVVHRTSHGNGGLTASPDLTRRAEARKGLDRGMEVWIPS